MATNEGNLLAAIAQLAESVRQNLARGSKDVLDELHLASRKPSTTSLEALRAYNEGVQLAQQGNHQAALKRFEEATKQDGNFALAFSSLARTYATLGYDAEASRFSRRAIGLSESLPAQEKYLISANHYQVLNDTPKAIEAYQKLVEASPNNVVTRFDLGGLYERSGTFDEAREQFAKVVELDPKFVEGLLALGRVEIRRGQPEIALGHLNGALTLAIQLEHDEARANILQAIGIAYKLMNRPEEALRRYEESLDIKRKLGQKRGMAASLTEIAQVVDRLGKPREAEQNYREALNLYRAIGDKAGTASTLVNLAGLLNETLGHPNDALPLLREALQIRRDIGNQNGEAMVLNHMGNVYLAKGEYSEAQTYFERALELRQKMNVPREMADTLHNLGETQAKMGRYDDSLARYFRALELRRSSADRRGAAIESYSIGTIFDYQARYGAAVKSQEEALATFRDLKQREVWLGEVLSGYGSSLSLSGRLDDAAKSLDEAMAVARELGSPNLTAQTLRFQADRLYYAGDIKAANRLAGEAVQAAARTSDRSLALEAQADVALMAAAMQPSRALASQLAMLSREAESRGLQFLSVDCSLRRAETLLNLADRTNARQETEHALARAETLGFRMLLAKAHYLRGTLLRLGGDAEAPREYASALRLLEEIAHDDGNQAVLTRADLRAIHADCRRWSKSA
jgi:tetratricopeptide (TPR) repeat protein